jgi:hypothetical protein
VLTLCGKCSICYGSRQEALIWYKISIDPQGKKEMLMWNPRRYPNNNQLDLFSPCPDRPTWHSLPVPVRRRVSELLVRLLYEHRTRRIVLVEHKEVSHE